MLLSKETVEVLKNFNSINSNLVINVGDKIETVSISKDIIASYTSGDNFDKMVSIYNLGEFLGVLSAFEQPDLVLDTKSVTFKSGKQKVNYIYADSSLLITPPTNRDKIEKALIAPAVEFFLSATTLTKLQRMASILNVEDLSVYGDGKTIKLKVFDKAITTGNDFELDTEEKTKEKFNILFKISKMKLIDGSYKVEISNKMISRFTHDTINIHYIIAVESDSTFA